MKWKRKFIVHLIDIGRESHPGTKWFNFDNEGDPGIGSITWDNNKKLHLWRNDANNR
ncbi:MAG: hypothetical protein ABIN89_09060 [Chitinophagaceae bacterium]